MAHSQEDLDLQEPSTRLSAVRAEMACIRESAVLLVHRRIRHRQENIGRRINFDDGTSAAIYRETEITPAESLRDPVALLVTFRLRVVRGRLHDVFRWESVLNTLLFVGFPGFVSKLWLAHDEHGTYRGVYQWDGADAARTYVRSLWRVLALVSVPGSISYRVVPGMRDDFLKSLDRSSA